MTENAKISTEIVKSFQYFGQNHAYFSQNSTYFNWNRRITSVKSAKFIPANNATFILAEIAEIYSTKNATTILYSDAIFILAEISEIFILTKGAIFIPSPWPKRIQFSQNSNFYFC